MGFTEEALLAVVAEYDAGKRWTAVAIFANPTIDTLNRLADNHARGQSRVTVQQTYPLDETPAALADFAAGTLGKLIIIID